MNRRPGGVMLVAEPTVLSESFEGTVVVEAGGALTIAGCHEGALIVYGGGELLVTGRHVGGLQVFPGAAATVAKGGAQVGEVNAEGTYSDLNLSL